jgi:DivIVA domain-containing protein
MDVTPQTLHDAEFREAKRGYHTGDVDDFLEKLAVGVEALQAELIDARRRLTDAEARVGAAEARAVEAEQRVSETGDADETLKRTLVLAQRTADAAIAEAQDQANRTLTAAEDQANRMLAEAHDAVGRARADAEAEARRTEEATRAAVLSELRSLESARDQLQADVHAYEQHVERQRAQVRTAASELQRLLDDPGVLRQVPPPPISDVSEATERARPLVAPPLPGDADHVPAAEDTGDDAGSDDAGSDEAADDGAADGEVAEADEDPQAAEPGDAWDPAPQDGPATQPVDVLAERDADDDAYLAELRKAMTDDTPLGPRDEDDGPRGDLFDTGGERGGRSRFGRRG